MIQARSQRTAPKAVTLVETAIVLSIVILLLFGVYEYGRFLMVQQVMNNAAREGARYAVVNTGTAQTSDIVAQVNTFLAPVQNSFTSAPTVTVSGVALVNGEVPAGTVLSSWNQASPTDGIVINIQGTYQVMPPMLSLPSTIPLTAQSVMYSEGN
jgi:Flp pilus assembly protein TadG